MGIRYNVWLAAMVFAILVISSNAGAQEAKRPGAIAPTTLSPGKVTGVLTDRLTKSQLKIWESIMEIVLAKDGEGRPVHPILYGLYRQADTSSLEIQIELSTQRATMCAVGFCRIELHTERTQKEVVVIGLNLGMIDRAIASELTRCAAEEAGDLCPFASPRRETDSHCSCPGHDIGWLTGGRLKWRVMETRNRCSVASSSRPRRSRWEQSGQSLPKTHERNKNRPREVVAKPVRYVNTIFITKPKLSIASHFLSAESARA